MKVGNFTRMRYFGPQTPPVGLPRRLTTIAKRSERRWSLPCTHRNSPTRLASTSIPLRNTTTSHRSLSPNPMLYAAALAQRLASAGNVAGEVLNLDYLARCRG